MSERHQLSFTLYWKGCDWESAGVLVQLMPEGGQMSSFWVDAPPCTAAVPMLVFLRPLPHLSPGRARLHTPVWRSAVHLGQRQRCTGPPVAGRHRALLTQKGSKQKRLWKRARRLACSLYQHHIRSLVGCAVPTFSAAVSVLSTDVAAPCNGHLTEPRQLHRT